MTDWLPSLNALRAFEVTARHLNYQRAANELGVTPAAVKQLVRKLEDALGTQLLARQGRGLALTDQGARASSDLTQSFQRIADTVRALRQPELRNRLTITSDPSFASLWLVPRLQRFRARHPEIEVFVEASPLMADLVAGSADVAIRFGGKSNDTLSATRLFEERLGAYCSPSLVSAEEPIRNVEDLARLPLIRWELADHAAAVDTARWNTWRYWLLQVGAGHVSPGNGPRFNDYNIALQAAIAGQGVIIGSEPILRELVSSGLLVRAVPQIAETNIGYDVVTTNAALANEAVARFQTWIIDECHAAQS